MIEAVKPVEKGIVLVVVNGPDSGREVPVPVGCYRVLGRADGLDGGTAVVPYGEQRRLEREDHKRMADHLRARAGPGLLGARSEVAAFERAADLDLSDEAVSQTHAMVFCDEAGASLVDVASTNGTWVNGDKVKESVLVDGDLLRVGETRVQVKAL
jgi:hypothetical protein